MVTTQCTQCKEEALFDGPNGGRINSGPMQPWRIEWRRAGALAIAIGLLSGCLLTSNFDGLTGGLVPIDGGADAGSGGASSSVSVSVASAGGGSSAGGGTNSSSAASSSSGVGAAFPSTPIRDDFHRPDGDLDGQWMTEVSS